MGFARNLVPFCLNANAKDINFTLAVVQIVVPVQ